jgi:hypothetical protein
MVEKGRLKLIAFLDVVGAVLFVVTFSDLKSSSIGISLKNKINIGLVSR